MINRSMPVDSVNPNSIGSRRIYVNRSMSVDSVYPSRVGRRRIHDHLSIQTKKKRFRSNFQCIFVVFDVSLCIFVVLRVCYDAILKSICGVKNTPQTQRVFIGIIQENRCNHQVVCSVIFPGFINTPGFLVAISLCVQN